MAGSLGTQGDDPGEPARITCRVSFPACTRRGRRLCRTSPRPERLTSSLPGPGVASWIGHSNGIHHRAVRRGGRRGSCRGKPCTGTKARRRIRSWLVRLMPTFTLTRSARSRMVRARNGSRSGLPDRLRLSAHTTQARGDAGQVGRAVRHRALADGMPWCANVAVDQAADGRVGALHQVRGPLLAAMLDQFVAVGQPANRTVLVARSGARPGPRSRAPPSPDDAHLGGDRRRRRGREAVRLRRTPW